MQKAEPEQEASSKLGLIAGAGGLPVEALKTLDRAGIPVELFGFEGLTTPDIGKPHTRLVLGQLTSLAASLVEHGVSQLLIVGKFSKSLILGRPSVISPDAEALRLLAEADGWDDEGLIGLIGGWLEAGGFTVQRQDLLLAPMIAGAGRLSGRSAEDAERADCERGRVAVAKLGQAGVGQCVAVREGCVIAVEAVEGTDAMIRRAGELAGPGTTIVKTTRPGQDRRFDLPAVGPETLQVMKEVGARALAVEAHATLVLERDRFREQADAAGIAVWGFEVDRSEAV